MTTFLTLLLDLARLAFCVAGAVGSAMALMGLWGA